MTRPWVWLVLILAMALGLRTAGIHWGLPNENHDWSLHPDEPINEQVAESIDVGKGQLDPNFYNYGSFFFILDSMATRIVDAYAPARTVPGWRSAARQHLIGRSISVISGVGLVWTVFAIGFRIKGLAGGVISSLPIAFSPALVVHSQFQTVDMLATWLIAVSLLYAIRATMTESLDYRLVAASAFFAGLSAGTKYTGILALVALIPLGFMYRKQALAAIGLSLVAATAGFLIGTPGAVLNFSAFQRDFLTELNHAATGHGLVFAAMPSGFIVHAKNLGIGVGGPAMIFGAIGLGMLVYLRKHWIYGLALFFVVFFVMLSRNQVLFMRYTFPLAVTLGIGLTGWLECISKVPARAVAIVLTGAAAPFWLLTLVKVERWMQDTSPQEAAGQYLMSIGQSKKVGLVSDPWFYSPTVSPDLGVPRYAFSPTKLVEAQSARDPAIVFAPKGTAWEQSVLDAKPDFITYSSFESNDPARILKNDPNGPFHDVAAKYDNFQRRLQQEYELVKTFGEEGGLGLQEIHDMMYIQPRIYIWQRKTRS